VVLNLVGPCGWSKIRKNAGSVNPCPPSWQPPRRRWDGCMESRRSDDAVRTRGGKRRWHDDDEHFTRGRWARGDELRLAGVASRSLAATIFWPRDVINLPERESWRWRRKSWRGGSLAVGQSRWRSDLLQSWHCTMVNTSSEQMTEQLQSSFSPDFLWYQVQPSAAKVECYKPATTLPWQPKVDFHWIMLRIEFKVCVSPLSVWFSDLSSLTAKVWAWLSPNYPQEHGLPSSAKLFSYDWATILMWWPRAKTLEFERYRTPKMSPQHWILDLEWNLSEVHFAFKSKTQCLAYKSTHLWTKWLKILIWLGFCTLVQKWTNFAHRSLGFGFRVFQGSN
jgi:hypothetical protein